MQHSSGFQATQGALLHCHSYESLIMHHLMPQMMRVEMNLGVIYCMSIHEEMPTGTNLYCDSDCALFVFACLKIIQSMIYFASNLQSQ